MNMASRMAEEDLRYAVRFRARSPRSGVHVNRVLDGEGAFRDYASFWQAPDGRGIDIKRSILDPSGNILVRRFYHAASIGVAVLADLSCSMRPSEADDKLQAMARVVAALGRTAERCGDSFTFIGCGERVLDDWLVLRTRRAGLAEELAERLRAFRPTARSARGLVAGAELIGSVPHLVLLISDFHLPGEEIEAVLGALAVHDMVPVVLWSASEAQAPQGGGMLRLRDSETGRKRLVVLRRALRERWERAIADRRETLRHNFARHGRRPFFISGAPDFAALADHLVAL
ncbi:hypothetical protein JZX93_09205 [Acidomonas methanolica]|uniref:DUF58 domain-containing protein n=1 Tax=Acidomonas methanolica TaxID=437 RepID=UPI002119B81C|nr:hypothetical protein [Acidomonas methanolica]MCQ9155744.1 hypothetical protein [Acidomonas methanolica]